MLKQFLNHIVKYNLCHRDNRTLLAVSGGLDSMVMLQLFKEAGFSVGVAHCNFQLRGDESDADEQFVKEFCHRLNIPFFSNRFDTDNYAKENGLSVQMAARELRYAWFDELLENEKFDKVATAHHFNDTLETIILNWTNGSSMDGLLGIPVINKNIIRPLLFVTREELQRYAEESKIQWREDSSNEAMDYQRNFVRHKIIPLLRELNPSLEKTVRRGTDKLKGERELLNLAFEKWKEEFVEQSSDKILIRKTAFENLPNGASILLRLIEHLGFNYDVCKNIVESLHGQPGKKFLGAVHELVIDRDYLVLTRKVDVWQEALISREKKVAFIGCWEMELKETEVEGKVMLKAGQLGNAYEAMLDAGKISFPLRWRQWKAGDVFYPLGMDHRKKVSDLLVDEKVPRADKIRVTVLESEGRIVWVVGHRIDNRFRITSDTRKALTLSVTPYFM